MSSIKTEDGTQIYDEAWGNGQPIVFSHGWQLSADAWDARCCFFARRQSQLANFDETDADNNKASPRFEFADFEIMRLVRKKRVREERQ